MILPESFGDGVYNAEGWTIIDGGQRPMGQPGIGFQPACGCCAAGKPDQPHRMSECDEQSQRKTGKHDRVQPSGKQCRGIQQGQRDKGANNADSGPQGGPGTLPEQGQSRQSAAQREPRGPYIWLVVVLPRHV
jgi:hypothetical protein